PTPPWHGSSLLQRSAPVFRKAKASSSSRRDARRAALPTSPQRQAHTERRTDTFLAFDTDRTAQNLNQSADDVQAQTNAAEARADRVVALTERLEDGRLRRRRDADAGVGDLDVHVTV